MWQSMHFINHMDNAKISTRETLSYIFLIMPEQEDTQGNGREGEKRPIKMFIAVHLQNSLQSSGIKQGCSKTAAS